MTVIALPYQPQEKQKLLHGTHARQVFYGGAAGGGKSHSLRWDAIGFCLNNPGMDAYLFRRTLGELEDNHIRKIQSEIPLELGKWNENRKRFEFYNKSGINFCYCEKETDVLRYQGAEIHWLGVDEAAHLTEYQLTYLRSRVRLGSWKPNPRHSHLLPRIVYGSNPGGPGHSFLKETFVNAAPPMTYFHDSSLANPKDENDKGWLSIYIPARMADNLYLDKSYAGQFRALAPELARALTEGDWDAVVGAALHNLSRERHQLRQFAPPRHWTRFMAIDWGTARPFSVGWYAVSDGATLAAKDGWPERSIPAGAVIRYAEWYGFDGRPNHGLRWSADQVALEILKKEKERGDEAMISYRVGDHQMWAQHDGPSPRERMFTSTDGRINLRKSKKDRKVNYAEIIARLAGNPKFMETGETWEPMFYVTANCLQFWRTCPPLVLDENDPDKGPGTDQEDHCIAGETQVLWRLGEKDRAFNPGFASFDRIEEIFPEGEIWTQDGWKPYTDKRLTQENVPVYKLTLDNGMFLRATGNHRVYCADGEYRRIDELRWIDTVVCSTEGAVLWPNTSMEKPTGNVASIGRGRAKDFIARCGDFITEKFRRAFTSIIGTATATITALRTWSCYPLQNIYIFTRPRQNELLGVAYTSRLSALWPPHGTVPKKASGGIPKEARRMRCFHSSIPILVWSAEGRQRRDSHLENIVAGRVRNELSGARILAITPDGNADVWNLHVPDGHNFVANGLVVHNCYDEVQYALASRPFTQTKEEYEEQGKPKTRIDPYATA